MQLLIAKTVTIRLYRKWKDVNNDKMATYGYIRVSTREQNEDRQVIALHEVGVPEKNIYMDKQSARLNRPQYKKTAAENEKRRSSLH